MSDQMLRVALLTHSVNPRGGVVHTLELADALHAAGHAVTIMAPAAAQQRLFRETRCALDLFPCPPSPTDADVTQLIRRRIDAYIGHLTQRRGTRATHEDFDILHAQDGIGANALTTLRERGLIAGFIRTVHHVDRHRETQINLWEERALRGARQLYCVSTQGQTLLERDYGLHASLVNNGVNLARFRPDGQAGDAEVAQRLGLISTAPLIVCIGGVEERKNTLRLLQAFIRIKRTLPRAQLALVGGASLLDHSHYRRQFDALLEASGLAVGPGKDVVRTGVLADQDLPAVLRLAQAMAFPSLREGFGLVVLEALACGTPTVVSATAPFTEYLAGDDVHWADPLDADSIAGALIAAVATARFAPPAVCARFSWTASAMRHLALYREFLRASAPSLH